MIKNIVFDIGNVLADFNVKGFSAGYYLSNYSSKAYKECSDSLAFMEHMDGGCVSFREGMTKPNPDFYKRFLEKFHLLSEECIFVDDTPENVEVAEQLGFHGIIYESYESMIAKIKELTE